MQQMQLSMGRTLKMPENVSLLQNPKMGRPQPPNLNQTRRGRLLFIGYVGVIRHHPYWLAQCDCGNYTLTRGRGISNSCGCATIEALKNTRLDYCHTPEFTAYRMAKHRCQCPTFHAYARYGGRGIEFRFTSFEEFYAELGDKPTPQHSIDRIDNNGHYEVGNVRWATPLEQMGNRNTTAFLTYQNETLPLTHWASKMNLKISTLRERLRRGWGIEKALTEPVQPYQYKI